MCLANCTKASRFPSSKDGLLIFHKLLEDPENRRWHIQLHTQSFPCPPSQKARTIHAKTHTEKKFTTVSHVVGFSPAIISSIVIFACPLCITVGKPSSTRYGGTVVSRHTLQLVASGQISASSETTLGRSSGMAVPQNSLDSTGNGELGYSVNAQSNFSMSKSNLHLFLDIRSTHVGAKRI